MSFRTVYGYTYSEKGWRMCNRDECDIVRIPDLYLTDTAPLRKGAPLVILGAWLYWYDRNVEEIVTPVWGWSATNDVANSNHLAGVAVDINAPKYPWGTYRMPADKIAKVEEGLRLFEGTVFWGRRWSKPDEMHYDMSYPEGDARNEAFAQKLLGGYLGIYKQGSVTVDAAPVLARATGLSETRAREILPTVRDGLQLSQCTNADRVAMWLAQIGHESAGFNATQEYDHGRNHGDPNEVTDRWRYKGRTWIQITWQSNYSGFSKWCFEKGLVPSPTEFVDNPNALADLKWAGIGPAWYWTVARPQINSLCDQRNLDEVTRLINGGYNGIDDRRRRYNLALTQGEALLQILNGGDELTPEQDRMLRTIHDELTKKFPNLSMYATGPDWDTFAGRAIRAHAFGWDNRVEPSARRGEAWAIDLVAQAAAGTLWGVNQGPVKPDPFLVKHAQQVLNEIETDYPAALQNYLAQKDAAK